MKLPQFFKLRHALENLDVHFLARRIAELEERLTHQGQAWEVQHTAITEEGIFYINPESGMATRVVLYNAQHLLPVRPNPKRRGKEAPIEVAPDIAHLNQYHLLRCNTLTQVERGKDQEGYRIAQRTEGKFYYQFLVPPLEEGGASELYEAFEDQELAICPNCFFKVTSLLEGIKELSLETFKLSQFFNVDFFRSWCRYGEYARSASSLADMYPKDWDEICRIRKEQVHYHCEACSEDYSNSEDRKKLHVHPIEHHKKKISFVRLQCLCESCLQDFSKGSKNLENQAAPQS